MFERNAGRTVVSEETGWGRFEKFVKFWAPFFPFILPSPLPAPYLPFKTMLESRSLQ